MIDDDTFQISFSRVNSRDSTLERIIEFKFERIESTNDHEYVSIPLNNEILRVT